MQFTVHAAGQISGTWKIPAAQSAQMLLYPGNPFTGLADPVSTGAKGGSIAKQTTSNTANFSVPDGPEHAARRHLHHAGVQRLQHVQRHDAEARLCQRRATACPASPVTGHIIN